MSRPMPWLLGLGLLLAACGGTHLGHSPGGKQGSRPSTNGAPVSNGVRAMGPTTKTIFGGKRPVTLHVPDGYDNSRPIPLIVILHGYTAWGDAQALYLGMYQLVNEEDVLMAAPNGEPNKEGTLFWNATDACCNFDGTGVDDVAYLSGLIEEISASYNVDPKRVYLMGHSNGAFMAYRMACDRADLIAGIVALAGATWFDPAKCAPSEPVSVLHIHGSLDPIIWYPGNDATIVKIPGRHPGAVGSVERWATYDQCTGPRVPSADRLDLDSLLLGPETTVEDETACPPGIGIELWTMNGSGHVPLFTNDFHTDVWRWMQAHPKP